MSDQSSASALLFEKIIGLMQKPGREGVDEMMKLYYELGARKMDACSEIAVSECPSVKVEFLHQRSGLSGFIQSVDHDKNKHAGLPVEKNHPAAFNESDAADDWSTDSGSSGLQQQPICSSSKRSMAGDQSSSKSENSVKKTVGTANSKPLKLVDVDGLFGVFDQANESGEPAHKKAKGRNQPVLSATHSEAGVIKRDCDRTNITELVTTDEIAQQLGLSCKVCKIALYSNSNVLVECQECHDQYHQKCHDPQIANSQVTDPRLVWYCAICTKKLKKMDIKVLIRRGFKCLNKTMRTFTSGLSSTVTGKAKGTGAEPSTERKCLNQQAFKRAVLKPSEASASSSTNAATAAPTGTSTGSRLANLKASFLAKQQGNMKPSTGQSTAIARLASSGDQARLAKGSVSTSSAVFTDKPLAAKATEAKAQQQAKSKTTHASCTPMADAAKRLHALKKNAAKKQAEKKGSSKML